MAAEVAQPDSRYGEVFDRGYQHYDGKRLGRKQAIRSLIVYSMKRAMGIRKSWTSKVLPMVLYVAIIVPLVVMIGLSAVVPDLEFASYGDYLSGVMIVMGIFVATIAPEMVCPDRRERTLPLYFARAITRMDYVVSKILATTILTMTMSVIPVLLLWLGTQLVSDAVWQSMKDNWQDLWQLLLVGTCIALVLGTLGLAVASTTSRKGVAVTIIILAFIMFTGTAHAFIELIEEDWGRYFIFLSITDVFSNFMYDLMGEGPATVEASIDFTWQEYLLFMAGLVATGVLFIRWRYAQRDDA